MDRVITAKPPPVEATLALALTLADHGLSPAFATPGDTVPHSELRARSHALACALLGIGLRRGQRVGVHMRPSANRLAVCVALYCVGAVVVPLDPGLPQARLMLAMQGSGAILVLHDPGQKPAGSGEIRHLTCDELLAEPQPGTATDLARRAALIQPAHPAAVIYGDGEQDGARGVVISQEGLLVAARGLAARYGIGPGASMGIPLSLNHSARLSGEMASVLAGAMLSHTGTASHLILAERTDLPATDTATPPAVILASGDGRRIRALERAFPDSRIYNCYIRAELAGIAICSDPRDPRHTAHTTLGRPLKGVEVMIVDPRTGMDMLLYEVGEIWIRGASVMLRYHDDPQASRKARDPSGFFKSGEMGFLDSEGRVIVCRDAYAQI